VQHGEEYRPRNLDRRTQENLTRRYEELCTHYGMTPSRNIHLAQSQNGKVRPGENTEPLESESRTEVERWRIEPKGKRPEGESGLIRLPSDLLTHCICRSICTRAGR
jgi:hypothetical protein